MSKYEEAKQHAIRSLAMLLAFWLGIATTHFPLKWLAAYIVTGWLIFLMIYWHRRAYTGENADEGQGA